MRVAGVTSSANKTSTTPRNDNFHLFGRPGETPYRGSNCGMGYFSIGENINNTALEGRVNNFMAAINAAI
jgi:hypothetical protein